MTRITRLAKKACMFMFVCGFLVAIAIVPDILCYPPAGSDYMEHTTATIELEISGWFTETITVNGPTTVSRNSSYDPGDGHIKIDTEIISMNLVGTSYHIGPITIVESPSKASTGAIRQQTAGIDFPADSFFDVFVEIQTMFGTFHNDDPALMSAIIYSIPPWGSNYTNPQSQIIDLKNATGYTIGHIKHVSHKIEALCCYPSAGSDYMPSTTATIELEISGWFTETITVNGPTTVSRNSSYDPGDGHIKIDTEIISMNLVGASYHIGPITIVESPSKTSNGEIQQLSPGVCYPANSSFNVFVEIQTVWGTFHNDDPALMSAIIYSIPPWGSNYTNPQSQIIDLKNATGYTVGHIKHVSHKIEPLIIRGATKDYLGEGYPQIIPVTIDNYYATSTTFIVFAFYSGLQPIGNATITLNPQKSSDAIIAWTETATWPKGAYNHTIRIYAYANNTLAYITCFPITFKITIPGDVDASGLVNMLDLYDIALHYGASIGQQAYVANYDVDSSGLINMLDLYITALHYGQSVP